MTSLTRQIYPTDFNIIAFSFDCICVTWLGHVLYTRFLWIDFVEILNRISSVGNMAVR